MRMFVNRLCKLCFGVPNPGTGRRRGATSANNSNAKREHLEGYRVECATGYLTMQQIVDLRASSLTRGGRIFESASRGQRLEPP
jgi:hypothetical protein